MQFDRNTILIIFVGVICGQAKHDLNLLSLSISLFMVQVLGNLEENTIQNHSY